MKNKDFFWGLLLVCIAGFIGLQAFGVIPSEISLFSIIILLVLLTVFVVGLLNLSFAGMLIPIALGIYIYGPIFDLPAISLKTLTIITVLLIIGLSLMFPISSRNKFLNPDYEEKKNYKQTHGIKPNHQTSEKSDGEYTYFSNRFGKTTKYINSSGFSSAELSNDFGLMQVYFDSATIAKQAATIEINNSFGEIQLYIPKYWNVNINVSTSMARVVEKNKSGDSSSIPVTINGNVTLGDLVIYYI